MITDERIASYIDSFNTDYDPIIMTIRREAEENGVPIIRKEAGEFIKLLMLMNKPENILEIGAAVGFSAIFMSRFLPPGGHITTIENYEPRIKAARELRDSAVSRAERFFSKDGFVFNAVIAY